MSEIEEVTPTEPAATQPGQPGETPAAEPAAEEATPQEQEPAISLPSQEELNRRADAAERAGVENQMQHEIARLQKSHDTLAGKLGNALQLLRAREADSQDPGMPDSVTSIAPTLEEPATGAVGGDLEARQSAVEQSLIAQQEEARVLQEFPQLMDPKNATLRQAFTSHVLANQTRLVRTAGPDAFRNSLNSLMLRALGEVSRLAAQAPAKASDAELAEKRELATPAQTVPRRSPQPAEPIAPEGMSRKDIFLALMKEGRPGFTQEEFRRQFPDG